MALELEVDAEALAVNYLLGVAELDAVVGSRVFTELPAEPPDLEFPLLVLRRIGGLTPWPGHVGPARLQIDAWAETKEDASVAARTALAALRDAVGAHPEGVVTAVDQDLGMAWSPDPESNRPRYVFGVALTVHRTV